MTQREWVVVDDMVTLPYKDLREILANRKRWIAYGKSYEVLSR